jgi:hypothetical protein
VLFVFSKYIHNVLLYAIVSLPIIAVIAYGLENWFQPVVLRYFKKAKQVKTPLVGNEASRPAPQTSLMPAESA